MKIGSCYFNEPFLNILKNHLNLNIYTLFFNKLTKIIYNKYEYEHLFNKIDLTEKLLKMSQTSASMLQNCVKINMEKMENSYRNKLKGGSKQK